MEEWKSCFENYEISNFGNCRRKLNGGGFKEVNGSIQNRGYRYFQINRDGKRTNLLFHHLVAEQFIGERPNGLVIDHIDQNKLNNNVSNLRYITQTENMRNTKKYINEIEETDNIKRRYLVFKKYREENKDFLKETKKQYYEENRDKILERAKNNKIEVICEKCNLERIITKTNYNRNKRLGVNTCRKCSSLINLSKINI